MGIRYWTAEEFNGEHDLRVHASRAHEHWTVAMNAWFWLVGPGSNCGATWVEHGRSWDAERERAKADSDRRLQGWSFDTLKAVKAHCDRARGQRTGLTPYKPKQKQGGYRGRSSAGSLDDEPEMASHRGPPPTVERDWPETFELSDATRRQMFVDAMSGKRGPLSRVMVQPSAGEVIFDGRDDGTWEVDR